MQDTEAAKAAKAARALINTLEAEASTEPRLLHALQFLAIAVERLAELQDRSGATRRSDFAER